MKVDGAGNVFEDSAEGLVARFLGLFAKEARRRTRSDLMRVEKAAGCLSLEDGGTWTPASIERTVAEVAEKYSASTARHTVKLMRRYMRFLAESGELRGDLGDLMEGTKRALGPAASGRSYSSLFPALVEAAEQRRTPLGVRDLALLALWAGTELSWRRLEALKVGDGGLPERVFEPWVARWLDVRGREWGPLLCALDGGEARPRERVSYRGLEKRVGVYLGRVGCQVSGVEARGFASESFWSWEPAQRRRDFEGRAKEKG